MLLITCLNLICLLTIENTSYVQVLYQLNMAASSVDDLDEWLRIFNVKLKHMREDIQSVCKKKTPIYHRPTFVYSVDVEDSFVNI